MDHAHHNNQAQKALADAVALSDAVQRAMDLTSENDTLIIVTADHSHVFTIAGYPVINTNILRKHCSKLRAVAVLLCCSIDTQHRLLKIEKQLFFGKCHFGIYTSVKCIIFAVSSRF